MDAFLGESFNFISCAVWVPPGVAKTNPDKVEISKEDLARLINETKDNVEELEEMEGEGAKETKNEDVSTMDVEGEIEGLKEENEAVEDGNDGGGQSTQDKAKLNVSRKNDDELDFESRYVMNDYKNEEDENVSKLLHLGRMTIHASSDDDPYITVKDKDDVDSDDEDHAILPTDNLIAVGHMEGDAAIMEVYVYNADQRCLYVHHDILLPAAPLCMEWLNYDPGDEELKPGNMVAIGSMSSMIEVWDLDLIDCLEPAFRLGKKGRKKKKIPGVGHKDAVLSLAWNSYAEHVLASGSADESVILWDMQHGSVAQNITFFNKEVQSLKWHHKEPHTLLTGACDKMVRLIDCNDSDSFKSWELDGEIECVLWDKQSKKPYNCLASTDNGTVYGIDCRQDKPLWTLNAHTDGCTGLQMSSQCPGCLVTVSADKSVKIWDIASDEPNLVKTLDPNIGTLNCVAACTDKPFVFCMGGDRKDENFKVLDIRQSKSIRRTFCSRIGLPADDDEGESENEEGTQTASRNNVFGESSNADRSHVVLLGDSVEEPFTASAKPKNYQKKKKGGHLKIKKKRL